MLSFCLVKQGALLGIYSRGFSFSRPLALKTAHWKKMQLQRLANTRRTTSQTGEKKPLDGLTHLEMAGTKHYFSVLKYLTAEDNLNFKVT